MKHLLLYDGECGFCQHSVQWLMNKDKEGIISFAPLHGETARPYLDSGRIPMGLDSLVYIRGEEILWYSSGVLHVLKVLPLPWRILSVGIFVPPFIRDLIYQFIAKHRHRIFASAMSCSLPSEEESSRFLP